MPQPTLEGALSRIRDDEAARFAVILAATFSFSIGFTLGFVLGTVTSEGGGPLRGSPPLGEGGRE